MSIIRWLHNILLPNDIIIWQDENKKWSGIHRGFLAIDWWTPDMVVNDLVSKRIESERAGSS